MASSQPGNDSAGSTPPLLTNKDKIAAIADEILSLEKDPGSTLAELLKRLSASERSQVYWSCKKFLQEEYGLLIADSGHVGISDRYIPNLMYPGDIVIYAVVDMLRTGDCIQMMQITEVRELTVEHAVVRKVSIVDGAVTVEDPLSGSTYTVGKRCVIGKVVKVITAFSEEWESTFYEFKDRKWLSKTLKKNLELHKAAGYSNQRQIVGEIERRLSKLREEQR